MTDEPRGGRQSAIRDSPRESCDPSSLSYGPRDRVRKRSEYRRIQSRGAKVHTRHFIALVLPSLVDAEHARLGITITKKIGNAVQRNLLRRRIREVFRLNRAFFPPSADIVLIAKRGAAEVDFASLRDELRGARRALLKALAKARRRS